MSTSGVCVCLQRDGCRRLCGSELISRRAGSSFLSLVWGRGRSFWSVWAGLKSSTFSYTRGDFDFFSRERLGPCKVAKLKIDPDHDVRIVKLHAFKLANESRFEMATLSSSKYSLGQSGSAKRINEPPTTRERTQTVAPFFTQLFQDGCLKCNLMQMPLQFTEYIASHNSCPDEMAQAVVG